MAKLGLVFLVAAALLLVSGCTARSVPALAPSSPAAEGVVLPAGYKSLGKSIVLESTEEICATSGWKECMLAVLDMAYALPACRNKCNIIVFRDGLEFNVMQFPNTDIQVNHIKVKGSGFAMFIFHDPAYFETRYWSGWENWAFTGQYTHVPSSGIVRFF